MSGIAAASLPARGFNEPVRMHEIVDGQAREIRIYARTSGGDIRLRARSERR
jgi:hypothetical protein